MWLVQPPALLADGTANPDKRSPASAPKQPATAAPTTTLRPAAAPLAALRRGLRRLAGGLRRRLAAAACMARPATLECGGCPGPPGQRIQRCIGRVDGGARKLDLGSSATAPQLQPALNQGQPAHLTCRRVCHVSLIHNQQHTTVVMLGSSA